MKMLITAATAVFLLGFGTTLADEEQQQGREPSFWMKKKLEYSQNVLNGLVTEDYEAIRKNATAMKGLNQIEYFVRQKPEGYRTQLRIFQYSVDELVRHSEDNDLDGATLAFTQLTISCVNCHKQVRRQ